MQKTSSDDLLVPDRHARVSGFGRDNTPIAHPGDGDWMMEVETIRIRNDPAPWYPGRLGHPHDACFDKDGKIDMVEWVQTGRVRRLNRLA